MHSTALRVRVLAAVTVLLLVGGSAPVAHAQVRSADWLRTVRESALWSGASEPAEQFTVLPTGSFLVPRGGSDTGRLLVYYPGDGQSRQSGVAWIAASDVAPSKPRRSPAEGLDSPEAR